MSTEETVRALQHHRAAAQELEAGGRFEAAVREYGSALRIITPDDARIWQCVTAWQAGLIKQAMIEAPNLDKMDSWLRSQLVELLRFLGRYDEAYHHGMIAYYLDHMVKGPGHNDTSASLFDLGTIELLRHNLSESERWLRMSQDIDRHLAEADPDLYTVMFRRLSRIVIDRAYGRFEEAIEAFRDLEPRLDFLLARLSPYHVAKGLIGAAEAFQSINEHMESERLLRHSIRLQQGAAPEHPQLGQAYSNLAVVLCEQLRFDEALHFAALGDRIDSSASPARRSIIEAEQRTVEDLRAASRQRLAAPGAHERQDIFLSMNSRDDDIVASLHAELNASGLKTWYYKDQLDWQRTVTVEEIKRRTFEAMDRAHFVVLVASNTSFTSMYVREELEHARARGIPYLTWFPHGVRICPEAASTRSVEDPEQLLALYEAVFRSDAGTLYGSGLRQDGVREVARAIRCRFAELVPEHPRSRATLDEQGYAPPLCPTRQWPVLVDSAGTPLLPRLIF